METTKLPRFPGNGPPLTDEERREWHDFLRSIGVQPASGAWPRVPFEPIKPRFYLLRKWMIWPVRRFIKRRLR
jgi:hypothetical protein